MSIEWVCRETGEQVRVTVDGRTVEVEVDGDRKEPKVFWNDREARAYAERLRREETYA